MFYLQMANPLISYACQSANHKSADFSSKDREAGTLLSKNLAPFSWLNHLKFGRRFVQPNFFISCNVEHFKPMFVRRKPEFLDWRSFKSAKVRKYAIPKKIKSENRRSANCHICGRSANLTNFLSPQILWNCDL